MNRFEQDDEQHQREKHQGEQAEREDGAEREGREQAGFGAGLMLPGADGVVIITWLFLAINVGVWLVIQLVGGLFNQDLDILLRFGAMFGPLIATGEYWRFFTAMFLHANIVHLLFNCFALFIFGRLVEGVYGNVRFTVIYLLAGLAGGALSYMFNKTAIGVGASGAIFGILGALAAYFIVHRDTLGEMGRRNLTGIATIAAINLVIGLIIPNIDNWAHFGGLAGGFVMGLALAPRYLYEIVETPFGTVRRIVALLPLGARWLAVPAFAAFLAAFIWYIGTDVSDTQQSQIFVVRAERLLQDGDTEGALQHAERAVELDSLNGSAFYTRGKIMARIGATDQARSDISASLRLPGLTPAQRQDAVSFLLTLR